MQATLHPDASTYFKSDFLLLKGVSLSGNKAMWHVLALLGIQNNRNRVKFFELYEVHYKTFRHVLLNFPVFRCVRKKCI